MDIEFSCSKAMFLFWFMIIVILSSANEPKTGTLPFILVQHASYPGLYGTAYRNRKRAVISKLSCSLELFIVGHVK